ncbi:MAG TPA: HD domain-containing protein [Gemmatimonadales bacterium]|nr:HD domain-containing protein [Gemmatimonadales bacterium]
MSSFHSTSPDTRPALPAWAVVSPKRRAHIERVVALIGTWADAMGVATAERERWLRAGWLHDAMRDAAPAELERWSPGGTGLADLRHGPASAARAAADGEVDRGVLDAVRYHSLGFAGWDMVGRVLYAADFLEPGRRFEREVRAELARRFPAAPDAVVLEVARRRLTHVLSSGWPIPEPTVGFWNSLVATSSGR